MKDQPIFIIHSDGTIEQIIESCEDCISRAAAIQSMNKLYEQDCKDYGCEIPECFDSDRAIRELKSLPSVQTKETYNKGWEDGAKAAAYHIELCEEENPTIPLSVIGDIKATIREEQECAYADFERYKVEYLGQDWEDVLDSLPQDDFRYGMQRCIEIINKHISGKEKGNE